MPVSATWTTPLDWATNYIVGDGDMDTYVSSNDLYLYTYGGGRGTSFPGSPVTGQRFIRTDRNYRNYTYDGTRWLGDPYALPFAAYTNLQPTTVSGNAPLLAPLPPDCDVYLHSFRCQMVYVATTNNGSNYWTINLRIEGASVVSIASFTTAAMSANTYTQGSTLTSFSTNPVTQGAKTISIEVVKTGSPGGLYIPPYPRISAIG